MKSSINQTNQEFFSRVQVLKLVCLNIRDKTSEFLLDLIEIGNLGSKVKVTVTPVDLYDIRLK